MTRNPMWIAMPLLLLFLAIAPGYAVAESFFDLFAGAAFTESADFTQKTSAETNVFPDLRFDTAPSFGIRGGHWFESLPVLGVEVDLSHFEPHRSHQSSSGGSSGSIRERDFKISSLSVDLRLRWPLLRSDSYPMGQLQPYLALGPGGFATLTRLSGAHGQGSYDLAASPGAHAAAGVIWQFHSVVGVFAEYRFTYFHLGFKSGGALPSDTNVATHHLLGGVSFRF